MATESRTPYTILGCLTVAPMSGYDIKRFLEESVVHFWSESYGQIYPALKSLEKKGLVKGREELSEKGRDKRVYRITRTGRAELREWLERPAAVVIPRYEHSLKLFFGYIAGPDASLEHIRKLRRDTEESLKEYREWEELLRERMRQEPNSPAPYWLAVLRGGVRYCEMVLAWCDEVEEMLRKLPQPAARTGRKAPAADRGEDE